MRKAKWCQGVLSVPYTYFINLVNAVKFIIPISKPVSSFSTDVNFFIGKAINPGHEIDGMKINASIKMSFIREIQDILMKMDKKIISTGAVLGMIAIILGAFGAHALKSMVSGEKLQIFETGVRYQFMHAMALITLAIYCNQRNLSLKEQKGIGWAAHFFIAGTLLFSGSLYILTLIATSNHPLIPFIGPITPLGGLCFMLGWFLWLRVVFLNKVDK